MVEVRPRKVKMLDPDEVVDESILAFVLVVSPAILQG